MDKASFSYKKSYYVKNARFQKVGTEWNANDWNAGLNPTGCHVLYYRTDSNPTKAVLHMLDGSLEIEPGKIYFVPAFSVLRSEINGEIEKYYVHFQSDLVEFGLYRQLFESCSVPANSLTKELFDIIVDNYDKKTISSEMKVSGAIEILMADLIENIAVLPRDVERFKPVLQYIENNYRQKIPVSTLAKILNVTTVYFSNIFKAAFHISPKQYILGKRLFESQLLLSGTDMSVREIAERVGFENENYFSELFSAKVGISALRFRKNLKM
ncbi:MAG: helix-turn-helix transcriptional regulator [Clostridia bacterium]|nr:helix-turn-helix transcriptional regulator [Clostridia bacterium]